MNAKNKWKILHGTTVEYCLEQDFFEIRGKIPSYENLDDFFIRVFNDLSVKLQENAKNQNIKKTKKEKSQHTLFNEKFQYRKLEQIPVLNGIGVRSKLNESKRNVYKEALTKVTDAAG